MKPEQSSSTSHGIFPGAFSAQAGELTETDVEFKSKKSGLEKMLSVSTKSNNTVIKTLPVSDEWNSLTPLNQTRESGFDFQNKLATALKFSSELEPSLAAMVVEFMVMTLHIMGDLQKAYMEQAINTLKLIQMDMNRQIAELKEEKEANFRKDLTSGIIEATSSVIQLGGSAVTASKLHTEFTKQSQISSRSGGAALEEQVKKSSAEASTNLKEVRNASGSENIPADVKSDLAKVAKSGAETQAKVDALQKDTEQSNVSFDTHAEVAAEFKKIENNIAYINAHQGIWNGAAGFVKATAQIVQAPLSAEAVGHGISAKEWENSKEFFNSINRQLLEWVSSIRDSIGRMISAMQEIQKQDALNALASIQKFV